MSSPKELKLVIKPNGDCFAVYDDEHADLLQELGDVTITRASHVEPAPGGGWCADMSPVGGPSLGPYPLRSVALQAETDYLNEHLF